MGKIDNQIDPLGICRKLYDLFADNLAVRSLRHLTFVRSPNPIIEIKHIEIQHIEPHSKRDSPVNTNGSPQEPIDQPQDRLVPLEDESPDMGSDVIKIDLVNKVTPAAGFSASPDRGATTGANKNHMQNILIDDHTRETQLSGPSTGDARKRGDGTKMLPIEDNIDEKSHKYIKKVRNTQGRNRAEAEAILK